MKVELLVSEWCVTCPAAEKVWREVADQKDIAFAVVDATQPEGREIVARLRVRSVPSVVIDGVLRAVGVQSMDEALALVAEAPAREKKSAALHIGMAFERESRLWIVSSMLYLVAAGIVLPVAGSLLPDGHARAAVHLFAMGFVAFLIFGLGLHMLPRFTNRPLLSGGWSIAQLACAQIGLPLLVAGLAFDAKLTAVAGGALSWIALALYAIRIVQALGPLSAAPAGDASGQLQDLR